MGNTSCLSFKTAFGATADYSRAGFNLERTMNRDATIGMRNIRADNGNEAKPNLSFHSFFHCLTYKLD